MGYCVDTPRNASGDDEGFVLAQGKRMNLLRVAVKRGSDGEVLAVSVQQLDVAIDEADGEEIQSYERQQAHITATGVFVGSRLRFKLIGWRRPCPCTMHKCLRLNNERVRSKRCAERRAV